MNSLVDVSIPSSIQSSAISIPSNQYLSSENSFSESKSYISDTSRAVEYGEISDLWRKIFMAMAVLPTDHASQVITVDVPDGKIAENLSTKLQILLLYMNRRRSSISATVSPSFKAETYPKMLSLVSGLEDAGFSDMWRADGPRSIRVGMACHIFVSVDMPVSDHSPSPDTFIEVVAADRIGSHWYDKYVSPRVALTGMTVVMFGTPNDSSFQYSNSIFKRERIRNIGGRSGGFHFHIEASRLTKAAV